MIKVAILDYGTGNINSILKALSFLNVEAYLANSVEKLNKADALILPGVGHFGHAIKNLNDNFLSKPIFELVSAGMPTLGICLGFQILTLSSEEANGLSGLGLLPFKTIRLKQDFPNIYKIPHIGWNNLSKSIRNSKLLSGISDESQLFYFSNSYGVKLSKNFDGCFAEYEHENCMVGLAENKNIYGVQFHPEKSRKQGIQVLHNFLFL